MTLKTEIAKLVLKGREQNQTPNQTAEKILAHIEKNKPTMSETFEAVEKMIVFLGLPDAINHKGLVWCQTHQLILAMSLKSISPQEAQERVIEQMAMIKAALK